MRSPVAIMTILLCSSHCLTAQQQRETGVDSLAKYFEFEDTPFLGCLFTYFPPIFIQHDVELKEFLRSGTFQTLRLQYGDRRAVDAVYIKAMQLSDNNTAIALLLATIGTFDHRLVGLKVPIFQLFFPLTNESTEEFRERVQNLPSRLYADSPDLPGGDRDKLQHFFGSAFLAYIFESRSAAERFGEFVEEGEDAIIVDGVNDPRDLRADRQGQRLGEALLEDSHRLPSEFLKPPVPGKGVSAGPSKSCIGVW